jgi:hypothetical protein
MVKVVLCGTHPSQYNGYSKVVFELANYIGKTGFIDLHIFGFQNFYDGVDHRMERALPSTVKIYDAFANEDPKAKGFGEANVVSYLLEVNPDIVIIYNDLIIVNTFLEKIHNGIPERNSRSRCMCWNTGSTSICTIPFLRSWLEPSSISTKTTLSY